jgi:putative FmdB family regulatory protein
VPTYQYACTACDERLEAVQKFTDDPLTVCDACGGQLRKVYSPVGIVFKGSGFYRTDSRKATAPAGAKDKQVDAAGDGSAAKKEGSGSAESGSSPGEKAGSGEGKTGSGPGKTGSGEGKTAKKAEKAGTGTSGTGSKVA